VDPLGHLNGARLGRLADRVGEGTADPRHDREGGNHQRDADDRDGGRRHPDP
jgi:hypothetical protein